MPHRNGNRPLAGPRHEIKRAIEETTRLPVESIKQVQASVRTIICDYPLAAIAVAALAGLGAGFCLKTLGNFGARK